MTNLFGCDVNPFERYFGVKAKGTEEPGSGATHTLVRVVCPHDFSAGTRNVELELERETCCGAGSPASAAIHKIRIQAGSRRSSKVRTVSPPPLRFMRHLVTIWFVYCLSVSVFTLSAVIRNNISSSNFCWRWKSSSSSPN